MMMLYITKMRCRARDADLFVPYGGSALNSESINLPQFFSNSLIMS